MQRKKNFVFYSISYHFSLSLRLGNRDCEVLFLLSHYKNKTLSTDYQLFITAYF